MSEKTSADRAAPRIVGAVSNPRYVTMPTSELLDEARIRRHLDHFEPELARLVAIRATDEEVWQGLSTYSYPFDIPVRRRLEAYLAQLRGAPVPGLWQNAEWLAIVAAYRTVRERTKKRPRELEVADEMGFSSEQSIRDRLRRLNIDNWRRVHALVAAAPSTDAA